ncbi:hypothetical protein [Jannaschia donghaensis]|nr:hypothetical protein [Jannaschia donghaensis]
MPADSPRAEGPMLVLGETHRVTEPEDPFQMIRTLAQEERDGRDAEHLTDALPDDLAAITVDIVEFRDSADLHADRRNDSDSADQSEGIDDTHSDDDPDLAVVPAEQAVVAPDLPGDYAEDTDYDAADPADARTDAMFKDDPIVETLTVEAYSAEAPQPKPTGLSDLSSLLDGDDALRDLIAEIVGQELAGELGERITRNVRKLVRREIRQMLASDEFE